MSTEAITKAQFVRDYVRELHEDNAAVFVGAGFSMSAGFVDWKGLLKDIIGDLNLDPEKEHDLVSVAQYSVTSAGGSKDRLIRTLLHKIGTAKAPTEAHRILAKLPIKTYWTTNYDKLIEASLYEVKKAPDVKYTISQLSQTLPGRDAVVYKMHGDIDHPSEAVICKDDYERYPFKMEAFATTLRGELIQKTFLFVGFSFTDPNIDAILSRVRAVLETGIREHYCIQKKVTQWAGEDAKDFQYRELKQHYFIRDLKRFNIQTVLVDDYAEIPALLNTVATRYRRSSVLTSGAADRFEVEGWDQDTALSFLEDLGSSLARARYRVITGFGVGVGSSVIKGVLNTLQEEGRGISDSTLMMRPFPHTPQTRISNDPHKWTNYRTMMIEPAGVAIFVFGRKRNSANEAVESSGMREEFELCGKAGVIRIPVGATGYMAETLWKEVNASFDTHYPKADEEFRKHFAIVGDAKREPKEILASVLRLIDLVQQY
jgi:NAD-dependent SIR2 family protein deacetylase